MKKVTLLILFFTFIVCLDQISFADEYWEQIKGFNETNLKEIAIDNNKDVIYAAGTKTVFKTRDNGKTWTAVFSVEGRDNVINFIGISEQGIFICTKNGVFGSYDDGLNWKRVFKGIGEKEQDASHIAFSKDKMIFLGTKGGLFISNDNGLTWQKDASEAGNFNIRWTTFLEQVVFIAAEKGVYKNSLGAGWKRTFVTGMEDKEYDADTSDENNQALKPVNSIFVNEGKVFLATDSGIFISEDKGDTWKRFSQEGLMSLHIKRLLFSKGLYALTDKGIFAFSDNENLWHSLYKGMNTKETKAMAVDKEGRIWVATGKGLYADKPMTQEAARNDNNANILELFSHEPGIREVQEEAIRYAEVHPDKIKTWRSSANKKAMLPNVSVGLDRYVIDYWHWDSGTNPDTLQRGKDTVSWDVTMTWDMGELIWNSDQTSIDTRSKLMVELRDDIMNEVTRTYFERRRLQIELLTSPPQDLKLGLEKDLRLQELTADIDGLTGGYFSRHIEE